MRDLVVLTACKDSEHTLRGLLARPQAIGIRAVDAEFLRHPHRDPGCLNDPGSLLRTQVRSFSHALVVFDREGSGGESRGDADQLARAVEQLLEREGWGTRSRCVVIDPELEAWVWSSSPRVDEVLGWGGAEVPLRAWLADRGFLDTPSPKPARPKDAMEAALRERMVPWSASLFEQLAARVSVRGCTDPAFNKLVGVLRSWYGTV